MKNDKEKNYHLQVYNILRTFSDDELSSFARFIKSPYHNNNSSLFKLFKYLMKFYPDFKSKRLTSEVISHELGLPAKNNYNYARKSMSSLVKCILEFMAIEKLMKNDLTLLNLTLEELIKRDLPATASKVIKKIPGEYYQNNLNSLNTNDLSLLKTNIANFRVLYSGFLMKKKYTSYKDDLRESNEYLVVSMITQLIYSFVEDYTRDINFNTESSGRSKQIIHSLNFDKLINSIDDSNEYKKIAILYYDMLNAYLHFYESRYYYTYKNYFFENIEILGKEEIARHFLRLTNYCSLKRNQFIDFDIFSTELFSLYKSYLENDYFLSGVQEFLPVNLFRSILFLAINQKDFNWAAKLINIYIFKFDPNSFAEMKNFGNAFLSYNKGDNSASLSYINKIKLDHFIYKYDTLILKMKVFFEKSDFVYLKDLMVSLGERLKRDKNLNAQHKESYILFLHHISAVYNAITNPRIYDINIALQNIKKENSLIHKEWLISAVETKLGRNEILTA